VANYKIMKTLHAIFSEKLNKIGLHLEAVDNLIMLNNTKTKTDMLVFSFFVK